MENEIRNEELPVRRFASKAAWETPRRSRSKWSQINCAAVERLHDAKKAETRERRLAKFIDMLEAGETLS